LGARKWDRLIIVVLLLAVAYFAIDKYLLQDGPGALAPEDAAEAAGAPPPLDRKPVEPIGRAAIPAQSIAVLPFVNLSSDPEQEYFSDGLTEELLNLLAGIAELKVAARTSSFYYKDKLDQVPLLEIARQLEVAHVLEGSVRKSGQQVRITAQLIKADDGYHLWSQTYDRKLDDIFVIQDEISAAVVDALKVTLLGEAPHTRVINTESWELTLQGRFYFNRRGPGDMQRALELFQRAVELDPDNATAWVGVAPLYVYLLDPPRIEEAMVALDKALALEPEHPEALIRKAMVLWFDGQFEASAIVRQRAAAAGPDNPLVLSVLAGEEFAQGNFDQAIVLQRRAVALDPMHVVNVGNLAAYLVAAGRWEEAEPWALKRHEMAPGDNARGGSLTEIYLFRGDAQAALAQLPEELDDELLKSTQGGILVTASAVRHSVGDDAGSLEAVAQYRQQFADSIPLQMAYMHAWRGENDQAFEWLERTFKQYPDPNYKGLILSPYLYSLHDDPRWQQAMARFEQPDEP
jgi:TolB-like protein/Flp pilus assembly protein TadD